MVQKNHITLKYVNSSKALQNLRVSKNCDFLKQLKYSIGKRSENCFANYSLQVTNLYGYKMNFETKP